MTPLIGPVPHFANAPNDFSSMVVKPPAKFPVAIENWPEHKENCSAFSNALCKESSSNPGVTRLGPDPEQRVPSPKDFFEFVIQDFGSGLQEEVRASQRPVHLLQLDEASAHHLV